MSLLKSNAVQVGQSLTATNNFTLYQPSVADGTVRLGVGNSGSVTDIVTVNSAGNVGIGTSTISNSSTDVVTIGKTSNSQDVRLVIRQFGNNTASGISLVANDDNGAPYNSIISSTNGGTQHWRLGGVAGLTGGLAIATSGSERMRIDNVGNVGIGTSSPNFRLTTLSGATATIARLGNDNGNTFIETVSGVNRITSLNAAQNASQTFAFNGAGGAEFMRITDGGVACIGTTSPITGFAGGGASRLTLASGSNRWGVGPTVTFGNFYILNTENTGVALNSGNTSWSTASDERIKDVIEPIDNALEKVVTLRAVIGKYKKDEEGTRRSFLIAQDVQAVLPEAVDEEQDELKTLSLKYTEVIPLLVAAIQELKIELDSVKAELNTLKGN
jgi:hypothetical protein